MACSTDKEMHLESAGYRATELREAFSVKDRAGRTVTVALEPWAFSISGGTLSATRIGLSEKKALVKAVAARFDGVTVEIGEHGIRQKVDWLGAALVHQQRRRLLEKVPPIVMEVQRAILAATSQSAWLAETEEFYRERYLIEDVLKYRAAAVAMAYFDLLWQRGRREAGLPTLRRQVIEAALNWRGLFSPTGRTYTSLDRTLMKLPDGVPASLLCHLRRYELPRPITNRVELTTICLYGKPRSRPHLAEVVKNRAKILLHATEAEIAAAVRRIGEYTLRELSTDKVDDLKDTLNFLAEYTERYSGRLPGLIERVIRWHEEIRQQNMRRIIQQCGLNPLTDGPQTATARPKSPLPEIPEIRFLSTVGEIIEEGRRMQNCVATRAGLAVKGKSYLFHIEKDGEEATVEMDERGEVVEASGPRTSRNEACRWGAMQLRAWLALQESRAA